MYDLYQELFREQDGRTMAIILQPLKVHEELNTSLPIIVKQMSAQ